MLVELVEEVFDWSWDSWEEEWVFEPEVKEEPYWLGFGSPEAFVLRKNGEKFGGKEVFVVDTTKGPWVKIGGGSYEDEIGNEIDVFELIPLGEEHAFVVIAKYSGFAIPVGDGKYVLREPHGK